MADAVTVLTGTAAAAGIAWINALGNLAGTVAPFIVGTIKDMTGSFSGGLYALAGFALLAAIVTLIAVPEQRQRARLVALDSPIAYAPRMMMVSVITLQPFAWITGFQRGCAV